MLVQVTGQWKDRPKKVNPNGTAIEESSVLSLTVLSLCLFTLLFAHTAFNECSFSRCSLYVDLVQHVLVDQLSQDEEDDTKGEKDPDDPTKTAKMSMADYFASKQRGKLCLSVRPTAQFIWQLSCCCYRGYRRSQAVAQVGGTRLRLNGHDGPNIARCAANPTPNPNTMTQISLGAQRNWNDTGTTCVRIHPAAVFALVASAEWSIRPVESAE